MKRRTLVCVLRAGGEYNISHVWALAAQAKHWWPIHVPMRFVVLTDALPPQFVRDTTLPELIVEVRPLYERLPGWWAKMNLFSAAQDDLGDFLYVDLDTMVVGSLLPLLVQRPLTLLADFGDHARLQSGCMWLTSAARAETCAVWREDPTDHMRAHRGDGEFLDSIWRGRAATWQATLPGQVISYKYHVAPRGVVPTDARILCFHGMPRPWASPLWSGRAT